jgi:hypothetical protein
MFGLMLLVIIVALIFGGSYYWAQKRTRQPADATLAPARPHISLLTEAMAYVGAILVLAGGGAAIGQRWDDMSDWGHVGVFTGAALFFFIVGALLVRVRDAAVQRLIGVVWLLSSVGVAAAVSLTASGVYDVSDRLTPLIVGLATAAYSAVLWFVHRGALQNLALFAASVLSICGVIVAVAGNNPPPLPFALALWAFGIAWATLGWLRLAEPMWAALPLGTALALQAPSIAVADHGWLYAIGVITSAVVMAVSVPTRNPVFLGLGTVAAFAYVTATVLRYFGHQLGTPATLAITGVLIITLAVISARLMRSARPTPPAPSDHRTIGPDPNQHARPR